MSAGQKPLVLLHVFSTFRVGGPQMRFAAIANYFGRKYRHSIVAMDNAFDARDRLDPRLDVELMPLDYVKGSIFANIRLFRSVLKRVKPDLLVTYNWGSIEWAMANFPKLVRHLHIEDGFGPEEAGGQIRRRVLTRRFALAGSTVLVPSRVLEKIALEQWKISPKRIRYVPNGIDCDRFSDLATEQYPVAGTGPVIGTVAALRAEKNLPRLIQAFALLRAKQPCRLVIAGGGPVRESLEAEAAKLGVASDVTFTGAISDTERVYAAMDVFALSSDTEQMPLSVIEAMAAGLPIAATNVGDMAVIVAEENRPYLVPRDDKALAGAIEALLADPTHAQIGAANQQKAREKYNLDTMMKAYDRLFRGKD
jgi:glycosyltransferase involved in cell wall biosynthesis